MRLIDGQAAAEVSPVCHPSLAADQPQVRLLNIAVGWKPRRAAPRRHALGDPMQVAVDEGNQAFQRFPVPLLPGEEKAGHFPGGEGAIAMPAGFSSRLQADGFSFPFAPLWIGRKEETEYASRNRSIRRIFSACQATPSGMEKPRDPEVVQRGLSVFFRTRHRRSLRSPLDPAVRADGPAVINCPWNPPNGGDEFALRGFYSLGYADVAEAGGPP